MLAEAEMSNTKGKRRGALGVVAMACLVAFAAGCGGGHKTPGANKAGRVAAGPKVLRLGTPWTQDNPDAPTLIDFARQVGKRSGGRLKIQLVYQAGGDATNDREPRIARLVQHGRLDLAFIDARAWDELGVRSLQALQAPFLIGDDAELVAVVKSPLGDEMLSGLHRVGLTGLAMIPALLNHPVGITRPLVSLSDFAGARLAVIPARATDTLVRALGATPVDTPPSPPDIALPRGIDGQVTGIFSSRRHSILTANVNLPPDVKTLVVNSAVLHALPHDERRALLDSAGAVRAGFLGPDRLSEAEIIESGCSKTARESPWARIVVASPGEIGALARATQPISAELERDSQTGALIAQIRELGASLPAVAPLSIPAAGCRPAAGRSASGKPRPASLLNGTYRFILTKADARSKGTPNDRSPAGLAQYPACSSVTLRDGKWLMESCSGDPDPATGTYTQAGDRVSFDWPETHSQLTFTFSVGRDRSLRLRAVPPMEAGDRFVWSTKPWRRIGPPVKRIP
jgi:TRAP-type C4-dicarboxylate transport system substrate-binding protein